MSDQKHELNEEEIIDVFRRLRLLDPEQTRKMAEFARTDDELVEGKRTQTWIVTSSSTSLGSTTDA